MGGGVCFPLPVAVLAHSSSRLPVVAVARYEVIYEVLRVLRYFVQYCTEHSGGRGVAFCGITGGSWRRQLVRPGDSWWPGGTVLRTVLTVSAMGGRGKRVSGTNLTVRLS